MAYRVSGRTKRGGSVGVFVDTARALTKAEVYLEDGLTQIEFRGDDGKLIEPDDMRKRARR
jgi:hypothetical protein